MPWFKRKEPVSEESDIQRIWYDEAKEMDLKHLPRFVKRLATAYEHDYGTICHAIAAAMLGTARAVDRAPEGGITGFQAEAAMWEFIKRWMCHSGPMRLLKAEDMLYPQCEKQFTTITTSTWRHLQAKARENLDDDSPASPQVITHWKSIVDGCVPFGYRVED